MPDHLKMLGKRFDGAGDAVAPRLRRQAAAAQFDEIAGSRQGDEQFAVRNQDARQFGGIHAARDAHGGGKRAIAVGQKAVRISNHPFTSGVSFGGSFDGDGRDIHAVPF